MKPRSMTPAERDASVIWYTAETVELDNGQLENCRLYFWGAWVMVQQDGKLVSIPSHRVHWVFNLKVIEGGREG